MPTRIYVEVGVDMRNLSAARRLGVGERRERRDEDGRRGGGRAVRAVALVVVVARVVVAAAGRVVVVELRAELRAAAGARRREGARVGRLAPWLFSALIFTTLANMPSPSCSFSTQSFLTSSSLS